MKMRYLLVLLLLPVCVFAGDVTVSMDFEPPQATALQSEGGAELVVYGSDTVFVDEFFGNQGSMDDDFVVESTETGGSGESVEAGEETQSTPVGIGLGASALFNKNLQIYSLPLSYKLTKDLKVMLSVPYVIRKLEFEGKTYETSGLGDVAGGIAYRLVNMNRFQAVSTLKATFPTGDAEATDGDFSVPLGLGTYSFYVNQSLSGFLDKAKHIKLHAAAGYRYYMDADYTVGDVDTEMDKGDVYNASAGIGFHFHQLKYPIIADVKFSFFQSNEGQVKYESGEWLDADDYVQTMDVIPTVRVGLYKNISLMAGAVIPVSSKYDDDAEEETRSVSYLLALTSLF